MRHFSDIVGDCSGIVTRGYFVPPPISEARGILPLLAEKYHIQLCNVMYEPSLVSNQPRVRLEIEMDSESMKQLCEDLRRAVLEPIIPSPYVTYTTSTTPLPPSVTITPISDGRPFIRCTAEQKENFIRMIEKYCDTCFLGTCDPQDEDDCRKCLERRVHWEIE